MHKSRHHLSLSPGSPPSTLSFLIPGTRGREGYSGAFIDSSKCKFPLFPWQANASSYRITAPHQRAEGKDGHSVSWHSHTLVCFLFQTVSVHGFYSTFLACPVLIWLLLFLCCFARFQLLEIFFPPRQLPKGLGPHVCCYMQKTSADEHIWRNP